MNPNNYINKFFVITKDHRLGSTEWFKGDMFKVISLIDEGELTILKCRWFNDKRIHGPADLYVDDLAQFHQIAGRLCKNEGREFKRLLNGK